jgi:hypothetical protein
VVAFVVRGVHHDNDDKDSWDLIMQCPDTDVVYNTATVTVGSIGYNDTDVVTVRNGTSTHYDTHYIAMSLIHIIPITCHCVVYSICVNEHVPIISI